MLRKDEYKLDDGDDEILVYHCPDKASGTKLGSSTSGCAADDEKDELFRFKGIEKLLTSTGAEVTQGSTAAVCLRMLSGPHPRFGHTFVQIYQRIKKVASIASTAGGGEVASV